MSDKTADNQPTEAELKSLLIEKGQEYLIGWALHDPDEIRKRGMKMSWLLHEFEHYQKQEVAEDPRWRGWFARDPVENDNWMMWVFEVCGWEEGAFHPMDAWLHPPASWNEGLDGVSNKTMSHEQAASKWRSLMLEAKSSWDKAWEAQSHDDGEAQRTLESGYCQPASAKSVHWREYLKGDKRFLEQANEN